jgi:Fe-S-cluster formation regulator IscX/YfhJ
VSRRYDLCAHRVRYSDVSELIVDVDDQTPDPAGCREGALEALKSQLPFLGHAPRCYDT